MNHIKELQLILHRYGDNMEQDLKERWNSWEKDMSIPEKYEAIGGIMARQVTIALNFISCSSIWNRHIAPIIMRSLIDNYINFAWIMKDPLERSRMYIHYGLGQAKLELEHLKNVVADNEKVQPLIVVTEDWINRQRYTFLTEVSLKPWSEKTVRQMAEEADCLDIYNYAYQPFSSIAHNMWNHVGFVNMVESENPLHKYFKKPGILKTPPDLHYLELCAKYVDKMFQLFDNEMKFTPSRISSFKILLEEMDTLIERFSDIENQESNNL